MVRKVRARNGEGTSAAISVQFDLTDPAQRRAFEVAQRLANPHGRRKDLIVLLLNAIADYEVATGREAHADMLGGTLVANALMGKAESGRQQVVAVPPDNTGMPSILESSGGKASAEEQAARFSKSFSSRFGKG